MKSCFHPDVHPLTAMFTFTFPMFKYSLSLSQISTMKSCFHPNVHPLTAIFTHRTIPCGRIFSSASFLYPLLQCHHQIYLLIFLLFHLSAAMPILDFSFNFSHRAICGIPWNHTFSLSIPTTAVGMNAFQKKKNSLIQSLL